MGGRGTLVQLLHRLRPQAAGIDDQLVIIEIDMRDVDAVFWAPDLQSMLRETYIQFRNLLR